MHFSDYGIVGAVRVRALVCNRSILGSSVKKLPVIQDSREMETPR